MGSQTFHLRTFHLLTFHLRRFTFGTFHLRTFHLRDLSPSGLFTFSTLLPSGLFTFGTFHLWDFSPSRPFTFGLFTFGTFHLRDLSPSEPYTFCRNYSFPENWLCLKIPQHKIPSAQNLVLNIPSANAFLGTKSLLDKKSLRAKSLLEQNPFWNKIPSLKIPSEYKIPLHKITFGTNSLRSKYLQDTKSLLDTKSIFGTKSLR